MKKYRIDVYIADDHAMLNEGLTEAINHSDSVHVSRSFTTLADCRTALLERRPDVLLLDISMTDGDGVVFCQWLTAEYPKVKILAVTIHDEYSVIRRMLDSGVHGYLLKTSPVSELVEAITAVWQGRRYLCAQVDDILRQGEAKAVSLTPVERNVLQLICQGFTNPEIAVRLSLSTETVNWYRKRLLAKYGMKNSVSLVRFVLKEKIL